MEFRSYTDIQEFLLAVGPCLEQSEVKNNLMLGLLQSQAQKDDREPYMACIWRQRDPALVLLMTPPFRLIVSGEGDGLSDAVSFAASQLVRQQITLPGVIGASDAAELFAAAWTRIGPADRAKLAMRQRIYWLTAVQDLTTAPGSLRQANESDVDLVADWSTAFAYEAMAEEHPHAEEEARRVINQGQIYLWDDGQPVSMAARTRPTTHGEVVNRVYTPSRFRRRGYARSCVAALSRLILESGKDFCSLYTDLDNPTSNRIYQEVGYRPVCDSAVYDFEADES